MELREWQYINKPTTNSNTTSAASTSTNTGFKKRLDKLIKYHGLHPAAEVEYILVGLLTKDKLEFAEHYDDGQVVEYKISIDPTTEAWEVKIFVNNQLNDTLSGTYWISLLKTLSPYLTIPVASTPEYRDILHEWVAMNNKTSSSSGGYKKRFEKLIKYHIDHASSELESITKKDIKEDSFRLSEHYDNGHHEFDRDIVVSYDKDSDTFMLRIFVDGKTVDDILCNGYEDFVTAAEGYMFLPDAGTQEYDDLLTESLREWKYANPPKASQPASTTGGYWKRFNKLIYYHVTHKGRDVDKVVRTKVGKDGFHYTEHHRGGVSGYDYSVVVNINLATDHWTFQTYVDDKPRLGGAGDGYLELLKELRKHMSLPAEGTPDYDSLLTESLSIADEFKLYENLF